MAGFTLTDMISFSKLKVMRKASGGKTDYYGGKNQTARDVLTHGPRGVVNYHLWNNLIATLDLNKKTIYVTDAGYKSTTTKDRINQVLGNKYGGISQAKGMWYFHNAKTGKVEPWAGEKLIRL